jgi:hypothetical protein
LTLKICTYHIPNDGDEAKREIKKNQKECPDNPDKICSDAGFCYRYRSSTSGHCDLPEWEKPETVMDFQNFRLGGKRVKSN